MAFHKQKERILSGSLNLLPPGDKLPEGDSLVLKNWRVDQLGQLASRKGSDLLASGLSGTIHSLARYGNDRHAGVGTLLLTGPALATQIATGFDGNPIGFAAYQGFTWAMNQAKRLRLAGVTPHNWGIVAPTTAPTVTAQTEVVQGVYGFNGAESPAPRVQRMQAGDWADVPSPTTLTTAGTIACTNGSAVVTGTGTAFDQTHVGMYFYAVIVSGTSYLQGTIVSVQSATQLTLAVQATASGSALSYQIDTPHIYGYSDHMVAETGDSLRVTGLTGEQYRLSVSWGSPQDMSFGSNYSEQDQFCFWVSASDPSAVDKIVVTLHSQGISGPETTGTVTIPGSELSTNSMGWAHPKIHRRFDNLEYLTRTSPQYVRLKAESDAAWKSGDYETYNSLSAQISELINAVVPDSSGFLLSDPATYPLFGDVTWISYELSLTGPCSVYFDLAEFWSHVAGPLEGDYQYWVTFDNDLGHESIPSPASSTVTLTKQGVNLTSIPISADEQVTKRHIYREGGAAGLPLRVHTLADNTTTTWNDRSADNLAQASGIQMTSVNADPPPAAAGLLGPYFGRLIAWRSTAHPSRYWWNPTAQPWKWPGAADEAEGNWEDCGDDREPIVSITDHRRMLWMYKERSIWRLDGDPQTADPVQTNSDVGIVGKHAVAKAGAVDFFVAQDGVYLFNGDTAQKISQKINPIFKGDYVDIGYGALLSPLNAAHIDQCVLGVWQNRLYFSYPCAGSANDTTLVYDIATGCWSEYSINPAGGGNGFGTGGFDSFAYEGQDGGAFIAARDCDLFSLETGWTDGTGPVVLVWRSRWTDQGVPDNPKLYGDLVVDFRTSLGTGTPATLTVKLLLDDGTCLTLGTISSSTRTTQILSVNAGAGARGHRCCVRVEGSTSTPVQIFGVYLHFYVEQRFGLTFDSGIIDLGSAAAKLVDAIEFEIVEAADLTWALWSDLPGSSMASRATGTVTHVAGGARRVAVAGLTPAVEGRRLRLIVISASPFQMHGVRLRPREQGLFIDGASGETWETEAMAPTV